MRFRLSWLACALFSLGCDAGSNTPPYDPNFGTEPKTDDSWQRSSSVTPVEEHGQLRVDGPDLVNERGDAVQLKGVSSMWLNWENTGYAESLDATLWMRDNWNISVIRAAMGVDPPGAYLTNPDKAKSQVRKIVENAIEAGIYVIVDWHDHNAQMHEAESIAFFSEMAELYGDKPNVIWETFNEPLAVSWPEVIKPYHEHVVAAIREKDPDNIVILGTSSWSQNVDAAAADPVDGDNLMYTLHFYSCTHGSMYRTKGDKARQLGKAVFVTEWGATDADGGTDGAVCYGAASEWIEWMRDRKIGWTSWKLDDCNQDSSCLLQPNTPVDGGWTQEYIHGHGLFVRDSLRL